MTAELIQKEQLNEIEFVANTIANPKEKSELMQKLKKWETLGNGFKNKCKIYFNDISGIKVLETTIWMVSNEYVNLKGGLTIPVNSIVDVEF
ncbi:MAG: hypothetical protein WCP57_02770 [Bacteroidota bacterium]